MTFPSPIDLRGYRRPATPKEIADRAGVVLISSWNQAVENGNFRTIAGAANNPEPTLSYYGFVVSNDQFHGTQTIYAVGASDVVYRREFFLAGDGATFLAWELENGTKLINDWQFALLNGRYRSEANAVGAPDSTNAYYGFTINSDTLHGTQHVWARGATAIEYEREFYLGGSGGVEYSEWRLISKSRSEQDTRYAQVAGPTTDGGQPLGTPTRRFSIAYLQGLVVGGDTQNGPRIDLNGAASSNRTLRFLSAGVSMAALYVDNSAMSGGNAGSNLILRTYNDDGSISANALTITRATGSTAFAAPLKIPSYTVTTLPAPSAFPQSIAYVSNGAASKRLAVSDGTNWRFPDGAIVS